MKRTNKNRQAEYLQTGKSERTAVRAAKCVTDYDQENDISMIEAAAVGAAMKWSRRMLSTNLPMLKPFPIRLATIATFS